MDAVIAGSIYTSRSADLHEDGDMSRVPEQSREEVEWPAAAAPCDYKVHPGPGGMLCAHLAARHPEATKCRVGFLGDVGAGMCG